MNSRPNLRLATTVALAGLMVAVGATPALGQTAAAAGGNIGTFIQNIIGILTNNVVRGLAIIAVIVTGIATMFGHLDLRRAGTVILGIIVIFSAAAIVDQVVGSGGGA
ncbi:TrbC/VirB2 family protein [Phenylobacterium sp.]|uniref:TrbC/VirB2 family protein n=1 Tax=Phenylobacterium sp. TaxID=1871053 RepID=UPI003564563B